ncbi:MAG: CoxG family protein [Calditrichia bacterium]
MHLEGTHTLKASREAVWKALLDPIVLAKVTPGAKSLEPLGNDEYKAIFEVKMGPVKGDFKGTLAVVDKVAPESYKLKIKLNGKIGNVNAEGDLKLNSLSKNETEVRFSGDAKLSGTLARTGQRVLSGVANSMTGQFFSAIDEEVTGVESGSTGRGSLWQIIKAFLAGLFGKK